MLRVPSQCPPWVGVCVASLTPKKAKSTIPSQAAHESLGHSCLFAVESCRGRSPRAERICVMRSSLYLLQQGVFSSNSQSEIRLGRYPMASLDDQPFLPFVQVPRQLRGMVRVRWHLPSERPCLCLRDQFTKRSANHGGGGKGVEHRRGLPCRFQKSITLGSVGLRRCLPDATGRRTKATANGDSTGGKKGDPRLWENPRPWL